MSLQVPVTSSHYNYLLYTPFNFGKKQSEYVYSTSTSSKPPPFALNVSTLPERWPLIMFLHGSDETAKAKHISQLDRIKKHGIPKIVEELPHDESRDTMFPFVAISPQKGYQSGYSGWNATYLYSLLTEFVSQYQEFIDTNRIYLTGISMGGFGTFRFAASYPQIFAAIVPICGGCDVKNAERLKDIPIWNFHGEKDDIVPISESNKIMEALIGLGKEVKYTKYEYLQHDSWTVTYNNREVFEFF
eukprot:TRINITY_DN3175_c0_g1_i2.p1 TRINITY_DN3175_c0_g1~~TRINITY_DN3175_c0_g1_i2.p1  ORF type:complete len:280 (-),score=25.87 TRINITY_DN3175_c0_g1_i2:208-942(-)